MTPLAVWAESFQQSNMDYRLVSLSNVAALGPRLNSHVVGITTNSKRETATK